MLVFHFVPNLDIAAKKAEWYDSILSDASVPVFEPGDTASMRVLLARIVRDNLEERRADRVRIGVSSGLDSRICFGAALDVLPADRIHVFTHGHPGNRDYENAPYLLDKRTVHHALHNRELVGVGTGDRKGLKSLFDREVVIFKGEKGPRDVPSIGGRLGDAISGGHLALREPTTSWAEAKTAFSRTFSIKPSLLDYMYKEGILPADYAPENSLPKEPPLDFKLMAYDDQLDLIFRQHQNICLRAGCIDSLNVTLVAGSNSVEEQNGSTFQPFMDARWQKSFLRTNRKQRMKQKLYKRLAVEQYADIFPDLVDPSYEIIAPQGATATDWRVMWPKHESLGESAKALLGSLNDRGGWFDVDRLTHLTGERKGGAMKVVKRLCNIEARLAGELVPRPMDSL